MEPRFALLNDESHHLGQAELMQALKSLAAIPQPDVRNETLFGLNALLQSGHVISTGWAVIFEILISVPQFIVSSNSIADGSMWPRESLMTAFSCMKLVVDDFLEDLPYDVIIQGVHCVSEFSAQTLDVNISLTSIEMLWKVTDYIMTSSRKRHDEKTTTAALDAMFSRLSLLSVDSRPEIRNCATNTLFSAVLSNSNFLSSTQWKSVFDDIVFPLFSATEQMSLRAMNSNEVAITPEIKKGVKMALHHSRDTAHKQV